MEDWGYRVKDVQLTYKFDLHKNEIHDQYDNPELTAREVKKSDIERLQLIAEDYFWNYGHYFADPKLDKQRALDLYNDWTARSFYEKEQNDVFFGAEIQDRILGFLNFRKDKRELGYLGKVNGVVRPKLNWEIID